MDTTSYGMPRVSRIKAAIGALLATLAVASAVQATAPETARAMSCYGYMVLSDEASEKGWGAIAETWNNLYLSCARGHYR